MHEQFLQTPWLKQRPPLQQPKSTRQTQPATLARRRRQRWHSITSVQEVTKNLTNLGVTSDVCLAPQTGQQEDGRIGADGPPRGAQELEKTPTVHAGNATTDAANMTKSKNAKASNGRERLSGGHERNGGRGVHTHAMTIAQYQPRRVLRDGE